MTPDLSNALHDLLLALLSFATIAMTTVVVPYVRARVGDLRFETAAKTATKAVRAIEQMYPNEANPDKLKWAVNRAKNLATAKGVRLSDDQWETLIEEAVSDMKRIWDSAQPAPAPQPRDEHGRFTSRAHLS